MNQLFKLKFGHEGKEGGKIGTNDATKVALNKFNMSLVIKITPSGMQYKNFTASKYCFFPPKIYQITLQV